jgi:putative endonuclease
VAWTVYALVSRSGASTYVGITTDPERRLAQHNGLTGGGARATRGGRPWTLGATWGPFELRGEALRVEYRVKRLRGMSRLEWRDDVDAPRTQAR